MSKKITLRLKALPSKVLPDADDVVEQINSFAVRYGNSGWSYFDKKYWEPVPPPYVLPAGMGAVIQASNSKLFVRTGSDRWLDVQNGYSYENADIVEDYEDRRWITLFEGVEP